MVENDDVLSMQKVSRAMKRVFDVFADEDLTVAECVHVCHVLDMTMKGEYPKVHALMWPEKPRKKMRG